MKKEVQEKCKYPQYYDHPSKCCICGNNVKTCPCHLPLAIEHDNKCHEGAAQRVLDVMFGFSRN